MVFPTFFSLSVNLAIRSSEPQSAPSLVFADCIKRLHLWLQRISLISSLTIWWCPCVESSLVLLEEGACYDEYVLLAKLGSPLSCFILYSKAKFTCYSRYLVNSFLYIPVPYIEKNIFFSVLVLEDLVGHHRTVQLKLVQCYWSEHRLALLWYWMVFLGNEQRSFCHFWLPPKNVFNV